MVKQLYKMETTKRFKISFVLNILIVVLVFIGVKVMVSVRGGALTSSSWEAFKYFTFQSNILMGIVALIYAYFQWQIIAKKREKIPHVLIVFNHVAVTAVGLTFVIVVAFLAPGYGFDKMYNNANLFYHALVPLTAIINFLFFEKEAKIKFRETLFAIIPSFAYGVVYFIVVASQNAYGDLSIDFYAFGKDGPFIGALNFLAVMAIAYTFGLFLYFINNLCFKKRK